MNKQTLEKNISWDEYGIGHVQVLIPIFGREIEFEFFSNHDGEPSVTEKMFASFEEVLHLPHSSIETIKDLLWEEADFSFTVADYGCMPQNNETPKEAHFREFGLKNREDCYTKSQVKGVQIAYESEQYNGRYAEIKIDTATDNPISIIVKNGKIIDYDDDGTYLGWFEEDEQHSHRKRQKVLGS